MLSLALLAVLCCKPADAVNPAPAAPPPAPTLETVEVGPTFLDAALPLPSAVADALGRRAWSEALPGLMALPTADLKGGQQADLGFLQAWALVRAGKAATAIPLADKVRAAPHAPQDYKQLTLGELLLAAKKPIEAAEALEKVTEGSALYPRARLRAAEARASAGATAEANALYEGLIRRADPADGTSAALWILAKKKGIESPAAFPLLERIWAWYPNSSEADEAARALGSHKAAGRSPSRAAIARRMDREMESNDFGDTTALYEQHAAVFSEADEPSCMAWYAFGRSHFKKNNVSKAAEVLVPAGRKCKGIDDLRAGKGLYVAGKSLERKKEWAAAGNAYELIAVLYPSHFMADDGAVLGGIAWAEAGEVGRARKLWEMNAARETHGDLAAEGLWRLAWTAYSEGDTAAALRWADRLLFDIPLSTDPVHVGAARYWASRWRIYPSFANPTQPNADLAERRRGIEGLVDLCTEQPHSFYALLAGARLYELAPDRVRRLPRPTPSGDPYTWTLSLAFVEHANVARGLNLARLGLTADALSELDRYDDEALSPSEFVLVNKIRERKDPIIAHDKLHHYLLDHPPATLGKDRDHILREGYPNLYWPEVQQAAGSYGYDPRIFHSLVREESSFNKDIVSWAGAKGLSQLMPATARTVAGWMDIGVNNQTIFDPLTNLRIGSRYLEYLRGYFKNNMFLAVPAYNAGEGNVGKWIKGREGRPTDEYIEEIPIRETRHYVKRVLGTYQIYRAMYGEDTLLPDWSHTNHRAGG
jgi:soluble lytic murein transglycosylase